MFSATITNEEINQLPVVHFTGRVIVVDSDEKMLQAEQALQGAQVIGFDTETRPAFQKGLVYKMALLQLSTESTAILFRLHLVELSPAVVRILESDKVLKIGAAIRDDIKGLQKIKKHKPAGYIDLQNIVGKWGIQGVSVKKMAAIILGLKVSKAQRLSNWEAQQLTESQIDYAAIDAWICREIYMALHTKTEQKTI